MKPFKTFFESADEVAFHEAKAKEHFEKADYHKKQDTMDHNVAKMAHENAGTAHRQAAYAIKTNDDVAWYKHLAKQSSEGAEARSEKLK